MSVASSLSVDSQQRLRRVYRIDTLQSADPSRTTTVRRQYAQRLRGRFADINTEIRRGVRDRDLLRLNPGRNPRRIRNRESLADAVPPGVGGGSDAETVDAFMAWLDEQQETHVMTAISDDRNEFIQTAYGRGLTHADSEARRGGANVPAATTAAILNEPVHTDSLQLLYRRNFAALAGITSEVSRQIARTLTQGFAEGVNPNVMASRLTNRIDVIGKTRATTLARTEVMHAHAEGTLNRFEQLGVEEVGIRPEAELLTAGDDRVCDVCASLEGERWHPERAHGILPVHPQCRCVWIFPGN